MIYMIMWETSFGPFFTTKQKAIDYLDSVCRGNEWPNSSGYPDIEEITLDDHKFFER